MSINPDGHPIELATAEVAETTHSKEPNDTVVDIDVSNDSTGKSNTHTEHQLDVLEVYEEGDEATDGSVSGSRSRKPKATSKSPYNNLNGIVEVGEPAEGPESDEEFASDLERVEHNYHKVYEKYQDKFTQVFDESKRLFKLEQINRTYMSYLKRRNNGILDVLAELEDDDLLDEIEVKMAEDDDNDDEQIHIDTNRIENIMSMAPKLRHSLSILTKFSDSSVLQAPLKNLVPSDLFIDELIPDMANDDFRELETNPQLVDNWTRRHYPNLVVSKLKPLIYKPYGVLDEFYNLNNIEGTLWRDFHPLAGDLSNQEPEVAVATKRKRKLTDDDSGYAKRQK